VQAAFEKVIRYRERFRGESRFSTWIHRTGRSSSAAASPAGATPTTAHTPESTSQRSRAAPFAHAAV
jgi:hypothetical protein